MIGRCGIGCEPASAATLAGIRQLVAAGPIGPTDDVAAILTGHLLKDPDYVYRYHSGRLETPSGEQIRSELENAPVTLPCDPARIAELLESQAGEAPTLRETALSPSPGA